MLPTSTSNTRLHRKNADRNATKTPIEMPQKHRFASSNQL